MNSSQESDEAESIRVGKRLKVVETLIRIVRLIQFLTVDLISEVTFIEDDLFDELEGGDGKDLICF